MGTKGQTHGYYRRDMWVLKNRHRVLQERHVGTKEHTQRVLQERHVVKPHRMKG